MSSNIRIQRICLHCGNDFTARTTSTLFCSRPCNAAAYKAKQMAVKIEQSNKETQRIKSQPIEELKALEFLTVTQVSKLIGCSRQAVYNLINTGKLKATNILLKKTIIKRADIDELFKELPHRTQPEGTTEAEKQELNEKLQAGSFGISDCYNITEIQSKFGISERAVHDIIKRHEIPKIKKGWYSYVPKAVIDKLLS
jgi:excisionase family DNA binding protein